MKYLLHYQDKYSREERLKLFITKQEMQQFTQKDEVYLVLGMYKAEVI